MREKLKDNLGKFIAIAILAATVCGVIAVIAVFGGFTMSFFGFRYESIGSIILFFFVATVASYPISIVAKALPNVLLNEFHKLSFFEARVLYLILDTLATAVGMFAMDTLMKNVSATDDAIWVISLVLALLSIKEVHEK